MINEPYGLQRFIEAQDQASTYGRALSELRAGRKRSHWMWFIFPQLSGLGHSANARTYAIGSLAEASAYLAHPVLGPRLRACTSALLKLPATTAREVLGDVDAMKLHSSMTLFARADPHEQLFRRVLDRYFRGVFDEATEQRL
jgi:uncharacterized protein (DUF1810 family)